MNTNLLKNIFIMNGWTLMNRRSLKWLPLFLFIMISSNIYSHNKMEKYNEKLKSPKKIKNQEISYHRDLQQNPEHIQGNDDENQPEETQNEGTGHVDSVNESIGSPFLNFLIFLTVGSSKIESHLHNVVTPYPYHNDLSGNYEDPWYSSSTKKMRWDIANQFLFSLDDVWANHLALKFRPFQYFYLQSDYHQLWESNHLSGHSSLSLFSLHFCFDRLRFEKFNLGWVLGVDYIGNGWNKAGFSYGLNMEIFPFKPISFFGSAQWSKVNSLPVNEFEIQSKYHLNQFFLSFGFELLKIASPTYKFVSIGGGVYF